MLRTTIRLLLLSLVLGTGCASEEPPPAPKVISAPALDNSVGSASGGVDVRPETPPPPPTDLFVVRLREGESLADLAKWSGLSSDEIRRESGLTPEASPEPGTALRLRLTVEAAASLMDRRLARFGERSHLRTIDERVAAGGRTAGERREKLTITIRRDEMIGLLSEWGGVGLAEVRAANPEVDLDRVHVGQRVVMPLPVGRRIDFEEAREAWHEARKAPPKPEPSTPVVEPPAPVEEPSDACARRYRLRRGDMVSVLARRWGVSLRDVRRCNPGRNLDRVSAGATLRVPDASRASEEEFSR